MLLLKIIRFFLLKPFITISLFAKLYNVKSIPKEIMERTIEIIEIKY